MARASTKKLESTVSKTDRRQAARGRTPQVRRAAKAFSIEAARLLQDSHCEEVLIFDTHDLSQIADFILLATGTSDRQIRSVGERVVELGKTKGFARYGAEHDTRTTWLVLDFVDVIVHLFEPATRSHYDLEMMWGDAPRIDWRRTLGERTKKQHA